MAGSGAGAAGSGSLAAATRDGGDTGSRATAVRGAEGTDSATTGGGFTAPADGSTAGAGTGRRSGDKALLAAAMVGRGAAWADTRPGSIGPGAVEVTARVDSAGRGRAASARWPGFGVGAAARAGVGWTVAGTAGAGVAATTGVTGAGAVASTGVVAAGAASRVGAGAAAVVDAGGAACGAFANGGDGTDGAAADAGVATVGGGGEGRFNAQSAAAASTRVATMAPTHFAPEAPAVAGTGEADCNSGRAVRAAPMAAAPAVATDPEADAAVRAGTSAIERCWVAGADSGLWRGCTTVMSRSIPDSGGGTGRVLGGNAAVRSQVAGGGGATRVGTGRVPARASRSSATDCGRSAGRGASIQSTTCRNGRPIASPGRPTSDTSSCTMRAVAGAGGERVIRKCSVAPSA